MFSTEAAGQASGPLVVITMNFGNQDVVTRSAPQAITVTNTAGSTVNMVGISFATNSAEFTETSDCGATLAAGASCTVYVVFSPMQLGTRTATLTIQNSLTNLTIAITGNGTVAGKFEIVNAKSGKVLDLTGGATGNGTLIQQNAMTGQASQQWQFVPVSGGNYEITNVSSGRALDVVGLSLSNGALVQQWDYLGGSNQQWQLSLVDDVHYTITNVGSGKVLDVVGGSTANGTQVQQWAAISGEQQQMWVFVPIGSYNVTNALSAKTLDIPGASLSLGTMVDQNTTLGTMSERWQLIPVGGGYFAIMNQFTGKVLDVTNVSTSNGAVIQQWDYLGGQNQQWQLIATGATAVTALPGTPTAAINYQVVNRLSSKALDDTASSTSNGTFIQQWAYQSGTNQQWQFMPAIYYYIENVNSGAALDVPGGSTTSGTNLQQWAPNGLVQQQWQIIANANQNVNGNPTFTITNRLSGMALDLASGSSGNGTLVQQVTASGSATQQWQFTALAGGAYYISNGSSAKVLDVVGVSMANGARIQQWTNLGGTNQQWVLVPVGY